MKNLLTFQLILILVLNVNFSRAQQKPGSFDIVFPLGDNEIPGRIELFEVNHTYFGKLEIKLPSPLNIALESISLKDGILEFKTSSPALSVSMYYLNNEDSVKGQVVLPGNRSFPFVGKWTRSSIENSTNELLEFEYLFGSDSLGFAFPTLSADRKLLVFSAYNKNFANQKLMYMTLEDGKWSSIKNASFFGNV